MLANPKKPWLMPLVFCLISIALNITYSLSLNSNSFWDANTFAVGRKDSDIYWQEIYQKTYTRMSPYIAGMYAAYIYHMDDGSFAASQTAVREWIAVAGLLIVGVFYGGNFYSGDGWPGPLYFFYFNLNRPIFGACLSYLTAIIVTTKKDQDLGLRPSVPLKACLSWSFWVPIAIVSYSFYLVHGVFLDFGRLL